MEKIYSVTEINFIIKDLLESNLFNILVEGEISNYIKHSSGHIYFSLKDSHSTISCVFFAGDNYKLRFKPENGLKVTVRGEVSIYPPRGTYQIIVRSMQPVGIGDLQLAFEQLKLKLEAEGLFDEKHKKEIPFFPQKIGVITSDTGAAIEDIINIISRRNPLIEIVLYPTKVQGDDAAESMIKALDYFSKYRKDIDLVIIGRGGGSIEDLWCFNDEKLARKIYSFNIPIISAVGHEIDFTICDFVADLRAPTPSAAAEIASPDLRKIFNEINDKYEDLVKLMKRNIEKKEWKLYTLSNELRQDIIYRDLEKKEYIFENYCNNLINKIRNKIEKFKISFDFKLEFEKLSNKIYEKEKKIQQMKLINEIENMILKIENSINYHKNGLNIKNIKNIIIDYTNILSLTKSLIIKSIENSVKVCDIELFDMIKLLNSVNPLTLLAKGYSIVYKNGKIINSIENLQEKDILDIIVSDGKINAEIIRKRGNKDEK